MRPCKTLRKPLTNQIAHSLVPARQAWAVLMPSPRNASAFSSFTTICSGVCFENFLMVAILPGHKQPGLLRTTLSQQTVRKTQPPPVRPRYKPK